MTPPRTFIFAGGGTGGHLYPALSIRESLVRQCDRALEARLLCSDRPLDSRILKEAGVPFEALRAKPFGVRPRAIVRFLRGWGPSVRRTRALLREHRDGVHLVALGGFVAAPAVQAARAEGVPITMINLDAVPGKANRWIARHAGRVISTAPVPERASWTFVPPIVREEALAPESASKCRFKLGLHPDRRTLMVSGGSQGAKSINTMMIAIAGGEGGGGANVLSGWQVLHQTGESDQAAVKKAYEKAGVPARVEPFVDQIGLWWGAADVAIGRAGAGTVGEAWANHVPSVLMPYPYHRDEHQRLNAVPLVEAGGAIVETDAIDATRNARTIGPILRQLLQQDEQRAGMRAALEALGPADGAERIASMLLEGC